MNGYTIEGVKKDIDDFLLKQSEQNEYVECLVELITNLFINDYYEENLDRLEESVRIIVEKVYSLHKSEYEQIYYYLTSKIEPSFEVRYLLNALPDDKTTQFTFKILKYTKSKSSIDDNAFYKILENQSQDKMLRFKAYYILFTFHHDKKNVHKCRDLVDSFQDEFSEYPLWHYTNSQICYQDERGRDDADLSQAISSANRCIEIYESDSRYDSNYPGIYHNYSELVFYASELGDTDSFFSNYSKAIERIEKAKNIKSNFAKYYYTHARLLIAHCKTVDLEVAKKEYVKAENLLMKAIDIEDSSRKDYAIKIVDYETFLLRCKTERKLKEVDIALQKAEENQNKTIEVQKQTEEVQRQTEGLIKESTVIKEELESQKKETLELLGFFSGVISLIVVTSQVVLNLDILSASVIMMLFLGSLILAFSFMHFIVLNGIRKPSIMIVVFIVFGLLLIAGGLAVAIVGKCCFPSGGCL